MEGFERMFNQGDVAHADTAIVTTLRTGFPDLHFEVQHMIAEGDTVACRSTRPVPTWAGWTSARWQASSPRAPGSRCRTCTCSATAASGWPTSGTFGTDRAAAPAGRPVAGDARGLRRRGLHIRCALRESGAMNSSQPPAPFTEMEQLFERLRSGLGAEWVVLEPADVALGAG